MTLNLTFQGHSVKCDSVIGLPIYAFISMFNSNIWPTSAPLQEIRHRIFSDLQFDLPMSLKVKCHDVIGLVIHGFLYSNYVSNCHRLPLIATQKIFSYLLSLGPNYEKSQVHRKTPEWSWMLQGQRYPIHVKVLPTSSKFYSVLLDYDRSCSR